MSGHPNPARLRQFVFGPFTLDDPSGELRKHGVRVRLQGQPLQILSALIRQPGQIITRDELHKQLWTDSTFVDFDHGLNVAMNRLRQMLGDSADHPRYIETMPGRGYRFLIAVQDTLSKPVLVIGATPATSGVEPLDPVQSGDSRSGAQPWLKWFVLAGSLASLAGWYLAAARAHPNSGPQSLRFSISPPIGYALEAASSRQTFALSPDGSSLAFTAMDASGTFQTFIRDFGGLDSRMLPNSSGSYHVFWDPDGRSLFQTVNGSLRRRTIGSESYQAICDTPPLMLTGSVLGPNLLISGRSTNFVVPVSGGTPRAIKELYPWPQLLPDGKHLLYTAFDSRLGRHRVRAVKVGEPGTARDLLETDSRTVYAPSIHKPDTGHLLYVRAGNILAQPFDPRSLQVQGAPFPVVSRTYSFFATGAADFSVSNNGMLAYRRYQSRSQIAWVDRQGKVLSTIGPANVNVKQARLSPDGRKIAAPIFAVERGVNDIWIIDAETGEARRTIVGRGHVDNPVWSPDSAKLAFNRAYEGPPKLFIRGLGEKGADEQLPEDYFQVPTDWSRDGRFIAFTNTAFAVNYELNGDVWLVDMARNRKVIHLISTPFHEANPSFSPDGRWLAFTSDESGRAEVYVQAFEAGESPRLTGERRLVSHHGAISLRWRRDGKELFYLAGDGRLYAVPITFSPKLTIGNPAPLFAISMEARAAMHSLLGFDVSADGQRLLVPVITSPEKSEIVVILNWEAAKHRNVE